MYEQHPAFDTPSDDAQIWHYTTLGRLASMLARRSLFFVRANQFSDPWEARYTKAHFDADGVLDRRATAPLDDALRSLRPLVDLLRDDMLVNCWCESQGESDSHWHTYGRSAEGVAIRSSVGLLKAALKDCKETVLVGRVRYIDFEKDTIPDAHHGALVTYKRLAFVNDHEVRAFIDASTAGTAVGEKGGFVSLHLETLIQEIVLSPMSDINLTIGVQEMVRGLGYRNVVRRSTLLEPPRYRRGRLVMDPPG